MSAPPPPADARPSPHGHQTRRTQDPRQAGQSFPGSSLRKITSKQIPGRGSDRAAGASLASAWGAALGVGGGGGTAGSVCLFLPGQLRPREPGLLLNPAHPSLCTARTRGVGCPSVEHREVVDRTLKGVVTRPSQGAGCQGEGRETGLHKNGDSRGSEYNHKQGQVKHNGKAESAQCATDRA